MAQFQNIYPIDLNNKKKGAQELLQPIGEGDANGVRVGAQVFADGAPVTLNGQCVAKVIRADGLTVPLTGTISGNVASVALDQQSCAVEGQIQVAVIWVSGANVTTLVIAYGTIVNTISGTIIQPSAPIPDLTQLLAEIEAMRQATAAANAAATKAVRYNEAQSLTDTEKARARGNISAPSAADLAATNTALSNLTASAATKAELAALADGKAVRYDTAQALVPSQMRQGRDNLNAADALEANIAGSNFMGNDLFMHGSLDQGTVTDVQYRIVLRKIARLSFPVTVVARTGFRVYIATYYDNGNYRANSGWQTSYTIPKDTNFRITIARDPDDTTETATINTFTGNVIVYHGEVRYDSTQALSEASQTQARTNIGAASATELAAEAAAREAADSDLKSAINTNSDEVTNALYNSTAQSVYQTASGWKLLDDGLCQSDSNYTMVKFAVTAGSVYKVVAGDKFQFQNSATVPSTGDPKRVGVTYGSGVFIAKAPTGATHIIISTTIADNIASVSLLDARTDNIEENLTVIHWNGLSKNLIGPEAGKLYPVYLKSGTYLTISTSDNQMGNFAYLNIYNSSKEKIGYYAIFPISTVTERTIQLSNDVYYLEWVNWDSNSPTGQLQVEIGKKKTTFEAWYPGVRELKSEIDNIVYKVDIDEESTYLGHYITQAGKAEANSRFDIKKYRVFQGDILYLNIGFPFTSSGGVFQFQTDSEIPSSTNPYIVDTTHNKAFEGQIVVPETAKWLMVTVKANVTDTNKIKTVVTTGYNTLNDRIKDIESNEYDANYQYKLNHFKNISTQYRKGNTSGSWYDRFVLMHLSDNHIGTTFARKNLIELSKIANDITPAVIVNSGDMTNAGMSSYTRDTTNSEFDVFTDNSTAIINGIPIVATLGNHDANDISNENISHASTKKDQWDHVFASIAAKFPSIVWGDSEHYRHYHYYDLAKGSYKLRIIALDSLDHDDYTTGDSSYIGQAFEVYSQAQIDWLCGTALNVPSGNYGIVIVNHFPFAPYRQSGYSDEWPALNDGYFAQGWKMIPEIVRAWKERTTFSKTYTDSKLGENNIAVDADFSSVPSGALFVCYMTGHTHSKNAYNVAQEDGEDFEQLMLCEDSSGQQGSALNRSYKYDNGIQNTAASQVVIDMAERKIYRTAYGVYQHCSRVPQAETQIFEF